MYVRARIEFKLVRDYSANGKIRNVLPTILELEIDISHDREVPVKNGGEKHTSSVICKTRKYYSEELSRKKYYPEVLR